MAGRSINLFLVRHGLSAANLDKGVNMALPDQEVPLAEDGHAQAKQTGLRLAAVLAGEADAATRQRLRALTGHNGLMGRTRVLCSPYLRTRQTAGAIRKELDSADVAHDYREELALREISFGLFDGYADEELAQHFPMEYAHYKKHLEKPGSEFWAPMPMGESRAQVADRVKGLFGTIMRDSDPSRSNPIRNFIVVSHGVTLRAFVMQWMHHPFEWYGQQSNPANASVQLIASVPSNVGGGRVYRHGLILPGYTHQRESAQDVREQGELK